MLIISLIISILVAHVTPSHGDPLSAIDITGTYNLANCESITAFHVMPDGRIIIGDSYKHCIHVYDSSLNYKYSFGELKRDPDGFEYIDSVTSDGKESLFVLAHDEDISKFAIGGKFLASWKTTAPVQPRELRFANGSLIVASSDTDPVISLFKEGVFVKAWGEYPQDYFSDDRKQTLKYPTGGLISIEADEHSVYCAFPLFYPILKYDYQGKLVGRIGDKSLMFRSCENMPMERNQNDFFKFSKIVSITLHQGYLLVVQLLPKGSTSSYCVDIFDPQGRVKHKNLMTDDLIVGSDGKHLYLTPYERNKPAKLIRAAFRP